MGEALEGAGNAAPEQFALLPYQARWVADEATIRICEKGRRTGITWAEAFRAVNIASRTKAAGGRNYFYISYAKDMAREFIDACADWATVSKEACGAILEAEEIFEKGDEKQAIKAFIIEFASGFRIVALSSTPRSLRGKQGDVFIDEAAFVNNLAELIKAALALRRWGGRICMVSTHDSVENYFYSLIEDIRARRLAYSLHSIPLDSAVKEGLFRRVCQVTGKPWSPEIERKMLAEEVADYPDKEAADEELFCIARKSGGTFISRELIDACMSDSSPVIRLDCPTGFELRSDEARKAFVMDWIGENLDPLLKRLNPDDDHVVGEDFGRSSNLSVLAPGAIARDLKKRVPFVVELFNVPFREQELITFHLLDRLPRFRKGAFDARGNGQFLAEVCMQRYGPSRIESVMLSNGWYLENMPPFKRSFEDRSIEIPRDREIRNDVAAFRKIDGIPKLPHVSTSIKGEGGKRNKKERHGDAGIALAMMDYASRFPVEEYAYHEVSRPGERARDFMRPDHSGDDDSRRVKVTAGFGGSRGVI